MRIVGRKEFLELPPGTVYAPYIEHLSLGSKLCVKDETLKHGDDWYYSQVIDIKCSGSEEYADIVEKAENDSSFEFECDPDSSGRDGMFQEDDRFLVLSKDDVRKIIAKLSEALD
jgi:hypothetical protein